MKLLLKLFLCIGLVATCISTLAASGAYISPGMISEAEIKAQRYVSSDPDLNYGYWKKGNTADVIKSLEGSWIDVDTAPIDRINTMCPKCGTTKLWVGGYLYKGCDNVFLLKYRSRNDLVFGDLHSAKTFADKLVSFSPEGKVFIPNGKRDRDDTGAIVAKGAVVAVGYRAWDNHGRGQIHFYYLPSQVETHPECKYRDYRPDMPIFPYH